MSFPSFGISLGLYIMSFVQPPVSLFRGEEYDERTMRKERRRREEKTGEERREEVKGEESRKGFGEMRGRLCIDPPIIGLFVPIMFPEAEADKLSSTK